MEKSQDCPVWVKVEQLIYRLLGLLLDKLERGVKPQLKINSKTLPELFAFNEHDTQYLWSLIETLQTQYQLLAISLKRFKSGSEVYEDADIRLNDDKERLIRQWLNRPIKISDKEHWQLAVENTQWDSELQKQWLLNNPLFYPDKSAEQVIKGLLSIKKALLQPATLRTLSSRHFWGDSKFLDNRQDYLQALFPSVAHNIQVRKLLVNVYLPEDFSSVLLIENQDTFLQLVDHLITHNQPYGCLNQLALVYSAGYRGAATRIRHPGNTCLSLMHSVNPQTLSSFNDWWEKRAASEYQTYFWGDLDFSGLAILAALRNTFPDIQAWQPGYTPMLNYHNNGVRHSRAAAKKDNQIDSGVCGCEYADTMLLPIIRASECFVDQEVVDIPDLAGC